MDLGTDRSGESGFRHEHAGLSVPGEAERGRRSTFGMSRTEGPGRALGGSSTPRHRDLQPPTCLTPMFCSQPKFFTLWQSGLRPQTPVATTRACGCGNELGNVWLSRAVFAPARQ